MCKTRLRSGATGPPVTTPQGQGFLRTRPSDGKRPGVWEGVMMAAEDLSLPPHTKVGGKGPAATAAASERWKPPIPITANQVVRRGQGSRNNQVFSGYLEAGLPRMGRWHGPRQPKPGHPSRGRLEDRRGRAREPLAGDVALRFGESASVGIYCLCLTSHPSPGPARGGGRGGREGWRGVCV